MNITRLLRSFLLPFTLLVFALLLAFGAGFVLRPWYDDTFQPNYPLFNEVVRIIKDKGIKELPHQTQMEYGMIRGILQEYNDPFTVFVEPVQNELQSNELEGKYGGIGVRLERDPQGSLLLYPYPDSPALKAGLQEGDRLLQVEELLVAVDTPFDAIQAALRGPVGQPVRLVIGRPPDYSPVEIAVKRAEVPLPSVTWNLAALDNRVGVIQVNIIAATTPGEIEKAVSDLVQRGAGYFVLDLRNNGGGLLDAGVDTARLFLKQGVVISEQYRGEAVKEFRVDKNGPLSDIPLVVLMNQNTASAAEIVAGALQANQRARLVGTRSYGKDTIQLVYNLKDGSSLHVTAAHWWLPGQEGSLVGRGLLPDVEVQEDPGQPAALLDAAVKTLNPP